MPTEHNKISPQMRELDTRQQLLVVTMEECGELIQSCSKLLRRAELYSDGQYVKNLKEELGDLLLQIVLQSKIAEENKLFSFNEVIDNLCEKLIRRHPYVFQDKRPHTIEEQREAYFKIKEFEKSK